MILGRMIPRRLQWYVSPDGIANESLNDALLFLTTSRVDQQWNRLEFLKMCRKIAANNLKDELRSWKRSKRGGCSSNAPTAINSMQELVNAFADPSPESDPAIAFECRDLLESFLAHLPCDLHREIWWMKVQGYSTVEIADAIGIPKRSVNRKFQQARTILRKLID